MYREQTITHKEERIESRDKRERELEKVGERKESFCSFKLKAKFKTLTVVLMKM